MVKKANTKKEINKHVINQKYRRVLPIVVGVIILILLGALLFTRLSKSKIALGDTVTVSYVGTLDDGTVFDTNIKDAGLAAGLKRSSYDPFIFTVGEHKVIPGFEDQFVGLSVGDKKKFTLTPDQAYGPVKQELFITGLKRVLNVTRYSFVSVQVYSQVFQAEPKLGAVVNKKDIPWDLKVVDMNSSTVKIDNLLSIGQKLKLPGADWESVVQSVDDNFILIMQNPKIKDSIVLPVPSGVLLGKVISVNDTSFDIDTNHPLAGKSLTFEVEVKAVQKAK